MHVSTLSAQTSIRAASYCNGYGNTVFDLVGPSRCPMPTSPRGPVPTRLIRRADSCSSPKTLMTAPRHCATVWHELQWRIRPSTRLSHYGTNPSSLAVNLLRLHPPLISNQYSENLFTTQIPKCTRSRPSAPHPYSIAMRNEA